MKPLVKESHSIRELGAVTLENQWMAVTVLADKGADIYKLTYKPQSLDVLWKVPGGLRVPGSATFVPPDSLAAWMDYYPGGWQELFPNGGDACHYKGGLLPFHGEVANLPWNYSVIEENSHQVCVRFDVHTLRTPFHLERLMILGADAPILTIQERLTNEGSEDMDLMWGHHPAFGAPFLSEHCRLDVPAHHYEADERYDPQNNPIRPGSHWFWPQVEDRYGRKVDLAHPRPAGAGLTMLGYFSGLSEGWYALTNMQMGIGVGLVWPLDVLPYVWCYQEYNGSLAYPSYGRWYTLAVEPMSSFPGHGLEVAIQKGTARRLAAGQSLELELKVVFFKSTAGVWRIQPNGHVEIRTS
ncbi:MAG: aldose 1-epimerase [Terriglobia bacterium]